MRFIAGALLVLGGSIVLSAGAVAEAIQQTVDRNLNSHLFGVDAAAPVAMLLFLIGLIVLATGFLDTRRPPEPTR